MQKESCGMDFHLLNPWPEFSYGFASIVMGLNPPEFSQASD